MRDLRNQLIELLNSTRLQQRRQALPPRLAACLVHDLYILLNEPIVESICLRWRLVSHEQLHRHLITIRCPDQAFYLDAIKGYFSRHKIQPLETQTLVVKLECDAHGCTLAIRPPDSQEMENFMFIVLHVSATLVPDGERLKRDLEAVLKAVDLSVEDFPVMRQTLAGCSQSLQSDNPDAAALVDWMIDDKYLFFGMQMGEKRLGIMRNLRALGKVAKGLALEIRDLDPPAKPGIEWLHLAASQRYLYSAASLEVVRICWKNGRGLATAVLLGHFSRSARYANASRVPMLERGWKALFSHPLLAQSAFYRREIRTLFDRLPKPLLLAVPVKKLLDPLKAITDLAGPVQTHAVILRPTPGNVCILFSAIPADRFGPNILARILEQFTEQGLHVHAHQSFGIGPHRMLLITFNGEKATIDEAALSAIIQNSVIFWRDQAKVEILRQAKALDVPRALKELTSIPHLYPELFPPDQFIEDMQAAHWVREHRRARVHVRPFDGGVELHIFAISPMPLGQLVAIVQSFGLTALQEAVVDFDSNSEVVRLSSIRCGTARPMRADDSDRLRQALEQVLNGEADNDAANTLVLSAGLDINEVGVLILLRNHLIQLLPDAAPTPLTQMLNRHPKVSAMLYRLFEARHRPAMPAANEPQSRLEFEKALAGVLNLADDRWFRALDELVLAGLRTNAYVRQTGEPVAVKIDPRLLSFVPVPVPFREVFVHGTHVEGVHLRGGPVARGGIRHSDRLADFRTEILELMATQIVKNGQIVPTGAKGGFVVRDGSGEPFVRRQYRIFIRALLSLTDNLVHAEIVPPVGMRIADVDASDPYLVVAADKGTAKYSDFANDESRLAGFWLDDAFASGGKHGYNHKVIGITAKGAWVCVAEHFAALGLNAYTDAITVVGIGDMGGDVFGNGMQLNENICLLAAFNHKHIFIDPKPDVKTAYAERKRLFECAGGWDQYKTEHISQGGGVFLRTAKSIPISQETQKVLGIDANDLSGEALIRAVLAAPVDLLYNGGIGTYVKASDESNAEVRDPANNAVRIDADELRCRVIGEGGNLGCTQKARLEYAAKGGLINTDATDNSAGVDMSDHEVNLKILFASMPGTPITLTRRNRLLNALTEEITAQCLADNLAQSRALSLAALEARSYPPRYYRLRDLLLETGRINAQTDPGMDADETLHLRPQTAVLLGHEKNRIHEVLSQSGFDRKSCFRSELLFAYFPMRVQRRFAAAIDDHPLANEIVNTVATNLLLNHMGLGCVHHLESLIDADMGDIAQALLISEFVLDGDVLRDAIWSEVNDTDIACEMQRTVQEHLMRFAEELLRLCPVNRLDKNWMLKQRRNLRRFRHSLAAQGIGGMESSRYLELLKTVGQAGLGEAHATHLATMPELAQTAAAVHLSSAMSIPLMRCLKANQACLHLLPFVEAEGMLRNPSWGEDQAHELRREWLHRLSMLKSRAVHKLLEVRGNDLLTMGEKIWQAHKHWPVIQDMRHHMKEQDMDHMRLMLLLTRLESLVEES